MSDFGPVASSDFTMRADLQLKRATRNSKPALLLHSSYLLQRVSCRLPHIDIPAFASCIFKYGNCTRIFKSPEKFHRSGLNRKDVVFDSQKELINQLHISRCAGRPALQRLLAKFKI